MEVLAQDQAPIIELQEQEDGTIAVSGRELHEFLEIGTSYKDWFPRMVEYGFEEGHDFNPLKIERVQLEGSRYVTRLVTDHVITLDMAKEISMIQRNEKGKQARRYFLQVEKAWNSPEMIMKRALQFADRKIDDLQTQIETDKPKVLFADAVDASHTTILVGELAKLINQNGVDIGQNRLFEWMREKGFLINRKGSDWNMPTQKSMDMKLFEIKERTHQNPDGSIRVSKTTKVTGKGQQYFINKFLNKTEE